MRPDPTTPPSAGDPPHDSHLPREMRSYLPGDPRPPDSRSLRRFYIAAALITLAFAVPLYKLIRFALASEIHSYILLIPFVSLYLLRTPRLPREMRSYLPGDAPPPDSRSPREMRSYLPGDPTPISAFQRFSLSAFPLALGLAALFASLQFAPFRHPGDSFTLSTAAYLLFLLAAALATLGWPALRPRLFPIAFLAFFIPLPAAAIEGISVGLQYASAEASEPFLRLTGMPVLRDGLSFKFPGLSVYVAEECSGIRSTLCLFITSVLGSYLLLRSTLNRVIICALVFPLGVLRNAFRITTISWLTVNVDPGVIDSALHHRGGPVFFGLSLVPLFLLMWWMRKKEARGACRRPLQKTRALGFPCC